MNPLPGDRMSCKAAARPLPPPPDGEVCERSCPPSEGKSANPASVERGLVNEVPAIAQIDPP